MGAMGRYIDSLTEEERDRIIVGQSWVPFTVSNGSGAGCLLGHAHGLVNLGGWSAKSEDFYTSISKRIGQDLLFAAANTRDYQGVARS